MNRTIDYYVWHEAGGGAQCKGKGEEDLTESAFTPACDVMHGNNGTLWYLPWVVKHGISVLHYCSLTLAQIFITCSILAISEWHFM